MAKQEGQHTAENKDSHGFQKNTELNKSFISTCGNTTLRNACIKMDHI